MDIKIHIDAIIHVHIHNANPGSLQPAIDKINSLTADEAAKTETLKAATDAAKGQG